MKSNLLKNLFLTKEVWLDSVTYINRGITVLAVDTIDHKRRKEELMENLALNLQSQAVVRGTVDYQGKETADRVSEKFKKRLSDAKDEQNKETDGIQQTKPKPMEEEQDEKSNVSSLDISETLQQLHLLDATMFELFANGGRGENSVKMTVSTDIHSVLKSNESAEAPVINPIMKQGDLQQKDASNQGVETWLQDHLQVSQDRLENGLPILLDEGRGKKNQAEQLAFSKEQKQLDLEHLESGLNLAGSGKDLNLEAVSGLKELGSAAQSKEVSNLLENNALSDSLTDVERQKTAIAEMGADNMMPVTMKPIAAYEKELIPTETIHVKISQPEEIPQKVLDSLLMKLASGKKEFEIQLEPQNLGKIAIKIAYEANRTTIAIACANTKTMELLANNARELGTIMETNLGSPVTVYIDKSGENYLNQYKENQEGQGKESQEQGQSNQQDKEQKDEQLNFMQQLRLGLVAGFHTGS